MNGTNNILVEGNNSPDETFKKLRRLPFEQMIYIVANGELGTLKTELQKHGWTAKEFSDECRKNF